MASRAQQVLEDVLLREQAQVTRVVVEIVDAEQFRWMLFEGERKLFSGVAGRDQVAAMTRATEILINTALGVPPECESPQPSLN